MDRRRNISFEQFSRTARPVQYEPFHGEMAEAPEKVILIQNEPTRNKPNVDEVAQKLIGIIKEKLPVISLSRRQFAFARVIALFVLVASFSAYFTHQNTAKDYQLSSVSEHLVGATNDSLNKKINYDKKQSAFIYNQALLASGKPDSPQAALAAAQKGQKVGGGADNYAVDLNVDSKKGLTVHDVTDTTGSLAISLAPQFKTREGKLVDGRMIYPLKGHNGSLVYTVKANGLKEDIVLNQEQGNELSFSYQLKLPKALEARLQDNGSIGVYSADTALFGNISFGSEADRQKVEAARTNGQKNHLVFVIPAPVITQTGHANDQVKASFELKGDQLTIKASNLKQASYPISIDPSVVVTSASDFQNGNLEGGIEIDATNNQIKRSGLTGGTTGAWHYTHNSTDDGTTPVSGLTNSRSGAGLAAYNGFLYAVAGSNTSGVQQTDVQYAPINSNGTIGTWSVLTNIQQTRNKSDVYIYNGYMYVMGGVVSAANSTEIAKIRSDGTLGAFSYGPALNRYRINGTFVGYNGYIYAIGGCYNYTSSCVNMTGGVEYTKIQADGTLSAWHYTQDSADTGATVSGLPAAKMAHGADVYNGYVYVTGGCTATDCSTATTQVLYAPLNADGTVGTWVISSNSLANSLTTNIRLVIANGYMYATGDGSNTTIYANINADGSNGTWRSTAAATNATFSKRMIGYAGYLYIVGGYNSGYLNYVQYSKVDTVGVAGLYTTSGNNLDTSGRYGAGSVAYNGCLYVVGGNNGGTPGDLATIRYATINSDGSTSAWSPNPNNLINARFNMGVIAYNGYLYAIAGQHSGNTYNAEVEFAPFNASGCGTGVFNNGVTPPSVGTARSRVGIAASNGYLYLIGGVNANNSGLQSVVEYAAIGSNGAPGTWTTTSSLNQARRGGAATASGGYVYMAGGDGGTPNAGVEYAPICTGLNTVGSCTTSSTPGTLGTWHYTHNSTDDGTTFVSGFTTAREGASMVAYNGYLYLMGGRDASGNTYLNDTQYARLNSDGTVGAWTATTSFTTAVFRFNAVIYNGIAYNLGGCTARGIIDECSSQTAVVQYASLNNGGPGTASSWNTDGGTSFSAARQNLASTAYNGYIYVLGGYDGSTYRNDVQYAPLNPDGSVGAWGSTSSFIGARFTQAVVVSGGYMYLLGGSNGSSGFNDVQYAPINSNGTVGAWHYTHNSIDDNTTFVAGFNIGRQEPSAVAYNGYLYLIGGFDNAGNVFKNDVQYAPINSNGTIGSWASTTSFTTARGGHASVAVNGYIYIVGGCTSVFVSCNGFKNDVQYAPINSNGTLGSWNTTNSFANARQFHSLVVSNGYMYLYGGADATTYYGSLYAPINSNGTLGSWNTFSTLNAIRYTQGTAVSNGYVYALGGVQSGGGLLNSVEYAGLKSIPRKGSYSWMSDLAGDAVATKLLLRGSVTSGSQLTFGLRDALNSNKSFGSTTTYQSLTPGSLFDIPATEKQYRQLVFSLDDSQSASFPDSLGVSSTISDFELYFHAASGKRLRGGKTFTGETQRSLDAQPQ